MNWILRIIRMASNENNTQFWDQTQAYISVSNVAPNEFACKYRMHQLSKSEYIQLYWTKMVLGLKAIIIITIKK